MDNEKYITVHNQDELKQLPKNSLIRLKCIKCGKILFFRKGSAKGKLRKGRETTFKCRHCNFSDQNKEHPEWQIKSLENNRINHGGILNLQTKENKQLTKLYRDNNPDWHKKTVESNYKNHNGKYHSQLKEHRDRMKIQGSTMGKKSIDLFINKYGVKSPMFIEKFKEACFSSNRSHHGGMLYFQTEECREKVKERLLERLDDMLGLDSEQMLNVVKHKIGNSDGINSISDLSYNEVLSIYKMISTHKSRYYCDGEYFDSMVELAIYVYNKDCGIPIMRNHSIRLRFIDRKNIERHTIPDFIINGKLIEVKGSHFFKPDGTMYCPYRNPNWSDDYYDYMCDIYNRKYQCGLSNGVIYILDTSPYAIICLNYIYQRYNINNFNIRNNPDFIGKGHTPFTIDKSKTYQEPIGRAVTIYDIK